MAEKLNKLNKLIPFTNVISLSASCHNLCRRVPPTISAGDKDMGGFYVSNVVRSIFYSVILFMPLFLSGCGEDSSSLPATVFKSSVEKNGTTVAVGNELKNLPQRGKLKLSVPPQKALFGMIYINSSDNREYIFDGVRFVPHDSTVDDFYKALPPEKKVSLTQAEVCQDGDPSCTPTGAHGGPGTIPAGHYAFDCKACHKVGGRLSFDKNGPAFAAGKPSPAFDAAAKTCSNISCHGVPSGTFSFYFMGGDGEPELRTINIYGNSNGSTPSWYSTGAAACGGCHGNPPRNGSDGSNVWHSGYHGNQGPTGARNQCQFCHPDASGANGAGTTITNAALHANGVYNIQATFTSTCFGCH